MKRLGDKRLINKKISERTPADWDRIHRIQEIECLYCWAVEMGETPTSQDWWVKATVEGDSALSEELDTICEKHEPELAGALLRIEGRD